MNLHPAFQIFLRYSDVEREKISTHKLEQIAISENLDDFLAIENSKPGIIEYSTTYGFRILCPELPELNQFVITKKGNGFAKARNLPYIYLQTKCEPPQLIVESPSEEAIGYGYAQAVKLPCVIAGITNEYPEGTMVVCITKDNQESAAFGYANAMPLPYQKDDIYIQRIDMLDTEYAAMLVDEPIF
jgi:hypothetical protein